MSENNLGKLKDKVFEMPIYKNDYEKFMAIKDHLTITTIQRYFRFSYPRAKMIIDAMVEGGAIEKKTYKLLSLEKYEQFISKFLKNDL